MLFAQVIQSFGISAFFFGQIEVSHVYEVLGFAGIVNMSMCAGIANAKIS